MTDAKQLQTARLTSGGPGSQVDNDMADMEAALRLIFGVTADQDVSAIASIGTGPDMTMAGTLTLAGDPVEPYDCCTKQYVDNTGGGGGATRCTVNLTGTQTVVAAATDAIEWDAAHIEAGGEQWGAGAPTRIIAPITGDYFITGMIQGTAAGGNADFNIKIKLNGGAWIYDLLSMGQTRGLSGAYPGGASFAIMEPLDVDDYIEVFVYAFNNDQVIAADSMVSMILLG